MPRSRPNREKGMGAKKQGILAINPTTGRPEGVDPRSLGRREKTGLLTPKSPIKAIREKCLDCCVGQALEVRRCVAVDCALWPFRMGINIFDERAKKR